MESQSKISLIIVILKKRTNFNVCLIILKELFASFFMRSIFLRKYIIILMH